MTCPSNTRYRLGMRRRLPLSLLAVCACFLAGCAAPKARTTVFDPAEYVPFSRTGTGAVEGQAFLKTKGGDVKVGAGEPVYLNPVTAYSTEFYETYVVGYNEIEAADPRAAEFRRDMIADGEGRFRFEGLPSGDYYLHCAIHWHYSEYGQTGGIAHARVTVRDGEVTRAVVTR